MQSIVFQAQAWVFFRDLSLHCATREMVPSSLLKAVLHVLLEKEHWSKTGSKADKPRNASMELHAFSFAVMTVQFPIANTRSLESTNLKCEFSCPCILLSASSDFNVPTWIQTYCERLHESFANTEVNDIHNSLFIHKSSYLIVKDNQVVMAWFTLGQSVLTVSRHLHLLHVPSNIFQETLHLLSSNLSMTI